MEFTKICPHSSSKAKQSEIDCAASMELFDPGLQLQRKRNKAEKPARMDITAFMGGSILLRILTKKNRTKDVANAKIKSRNIAMSVRAATVLEHCCQTAKRKKLHRDKMQRIADNQGKALNGIQESEVNTYNKPISVEMSGLIDL